MVFAISGALAGVAGMMIGTLYGLLTPSLGVDIGLKGIAVMIIGGLGNLRGAAVAALLLGVGEALTAGYIGAAARDALAWLLLLAILVVRPEGLFGTQVAEARD
jgi:branched-chain amino acid transport system permease protein